MIKEFELKLINDERSAHTTAQYVHEANRFLIFCKGEVTRTSVLCYKEYLKSTYAPTSVNTKLAAVNAYLRFLNRSDLCLKNLRVQKNLFAVREKFITRAEYARLLRAAKTRQMYLLIQTIAATGIRVSEVQFVTTEAARRGFAEINLKGKTRIVYIPKKLCAALLGYAEKRKIKSGAIFVTKNGKCLDRSNIWRAMKALCEAAHVEKSKVFPHNLRHLFAREFYKSERDIVRLADILGHSSIETTRIYTMETAEEQRRKIEKLRLTELDEWQYICVDKKIPRTT